MTGVSRNPRNRRIEKRAPVRSGASSIVSLEKKRQGSDRLASDF
jgi:hypothetical protein